MDESVVPTPVGPYGESKRAAERYILGKSSELRVESSESVESGEMKAKTFCFPLSTRFLYSIVVLF